MRIMRLFPTHVEPELGVLRGGPFFQFLRNQGVEVEDMNEKGGIRLGTGLLFVDAGQLAYKPAVEDVRQRLGNNVRVIMDVHFPLTLPIEQFMAFQPGTNDKTRDLEKDREVRRYWSDPINRNTALEMVEEADAVTCPNPLWAHGLLKYNANVFVLPDVTNPRTGGDFAVGWAKALNAATGKRQRSRLRLWIAGRGVRSVLKDQWDNEKGIWLT
jgi:hypothetical protein